VACEAENDCPYGGWLHPECTPDLLNLPREVIDNMGVWYCHKCTQRIQQDELAEQNEQEPEDEAMKSDSGESEDLRELEAEVEAGKQAIKDLEMDIDECGDDLGEEGSENCEDAVISSLSRHGSESEREFL